MFPDAVTFRHLFYTAQVNLGWAEPDGSVPFVPHSLRHGGATADYITQGSRFLEDILFRGRWASVKSTRHYIQQGPALLAAVSTRIPAWQREAGHLMAQVVCEVVRIPDYL